MYLLHLLKDTTFELEFCFEHKQRFLNASQSFSNVKFLVLFSTAYYCTELFAGRSVSVVDWVCYSFLYINMCLHRHVYAHIRCR